VKEPPTNARVILLLGAVALLAGCGGLPYPDPYVTSPQAECERNGGFWHANLGICEPQHP
jgi:hypothetical protein